MTDTELLTACKTGLGIPTSSTAFDGVITQKLLAVKSYMRSAGVSDVTMSDDVAVGIIVMGVADLWNLGAGEIKFSPAFFTLLTQLSFGDSTLSFVGSILDGATGVSVSVRPVLTFNKRISNYSVNIVNLVTLIPIQSTTSLDISGMILTISPNSDLDSGSNYAIIVNYATAFSGQTLDYKTVSFTTA